MTKREKVVGTWFGIFAISITIFFVFVFGAIFSIEYESNCTSSDGKVVCTTRSAWKGWSGVPVEALAGAVGTIGGAVVLLLKACKQTGGDNGNG